MEVAMPETLAKGGRPWQVAAWLSAVGILFSVVFLVHAVATSWAVWLVEHHAGDPLWVHVAVVGSALLVLAGPAIMLAGLFAIRWSWLAGLVLLLGGGFLTTGMMHLYPNHAMGLHDSAWGEVAEGFGLLLALVVGVLGIIGAWRMRRSAGR
jgi:hypothetical protein